MQAPLAPLAQQALLALLEPRVSMESRGLLALQAPLERRCVCLCMCMCMCMMCVCAIVLGHDCVY